MRDTSRGGTVLGGSEVDLEEPHGSAPEDAFESV